MDLITKRIYEIADVVGGGTPSTSNEEYWGGDIPWLSPADLTGYQSVYISHGEKFITPEGVKKSSTQRLPAGSVLFSSRAPIGYIAIAQNEIYTNQGFKSLVCKSEVINNLYLYYYLKLNLNYIKNFASGATFPELSANRIKNIKITFCKSLHEQQKIASILSAYDSQIENNQKRIKLLEQMAENLYKEWFVRFRFPGYEKEKMKPSKFGRIPVSFDVKTMGEVFEYYIGGGWGEEQQSQDFQIEASVIRGADFPNVWHFDISSCPRRYHKISNYKSRQLEPGDIVFEISGGTSEQPVGRAVLATKELIDRFQDKHVICASFCKLIRIKKDVATPYFFYYWLKYLYDTRIIDRFQLQSTGIINFKFESFLKKGTVVLPPMDIMKQFDDSVEHLYRDMNNLAKQNDLLTHQRDLLLPRLMSGKLSI